MNETKEETEQEFEEDKEEKSEEYNDVIVVPKLSKKTYNPDYRDPKFVEKLGTYYVTTNNYSETAKLLNEEFGTTISKDQVRYIYIKKMAKKVTQDPNAKAFFKDAFNRMKERWEDAWWMVGDLVSQYKYLRKELNNETDTAKAIKVVKLSQTVIQIAEAVRRQLEFIQKQQEQIKIQQETLIFSPSQINQQITPILKTLIKEGKIALLQDIPEWKIEKKESKKE